MRRDIVSIGTGGKISTGENNRVIIHALEQISLSFRDGDRVALVGHNGAGKTTLLKLLAGIYEPVQGRVSVNGSIASLFDLTAGIDMDATGHENIRLRGMLLGMSPAEIREQTQEIAEFSDLGDYLQMPLRTYSSGMLMRLSFSVVTSTRAEILIMDEMIGAGDAKFIEKANARIGNFVGNASILVLASHSEAIVRHWCTKAVLLSHGRVQGCGDIDEIYKQYSEQPA